MTEEQRRQAAAQRCADLMNTKFGGGCTTARDFGGANAFTDVILELDEQSRWVNSHFASDTLIPWVIAARKHILPEPEPSPVERLTEAYGDRRESVVRVLDELGLELREKSA